MKPFYPHHLLAGMLTALLASNLASAQTNSMAPAQTPSEMESRQHQIVGFLPKEDQDRVIHAYDQAIKDNPDLPRMQADLARNHATLQDASDTDRQAFMAEAKDYMTKLRAGMLKADPKIEPVLNEIEAHRAAMQGKGGGSGQ